MLCDILIYCSPCTTTNCGKQEVLYWGLTVYWH